MMSILLALACFAAEAPYAEQLKQVQAHYDEAGLSGLIGALQADAAADPATLAEALLTQAEWKRIEYEQTPSGERALRQQLGGDIDAIAQQALAKLEGLPETSEIWRMRADLQGVMMRSIAQKRKYKDAVEQAVAKALKLGPDNARAWATAAKRYLFADPGQGQDLPQALELLKRSLELAPDYEPAKLLRAYAHEKLGETATAQREWAEALKANPNCKPAKDKLAEQSAK